MGGVFGRATPAQTPPQFPHLRNSYIVKYIILSPLKRILILVLACLLPAVACNFPGRPQNPPSISEEGLRLTLTALAVSTNSSATSPPSSPDIPTPSPFQGLQTATPAGPSLGTPPGPEQSEAPSLFEYIAQSGDTLSAIAKRFGVEPEQITSPQPIPSEALIPPGQLLSIPSTLGETPYPSALLPDSEVVHSPAAVDFQIQNFVHDAGGYLSAYGESLGGEWLTGAQIIHKVAIENSINPRVLLAFLEYRSNWVLGQPKDPAQLDYPIGFYVPDYRGLYKELVLAAVQLGMGYYGWRSGTLTMLTFPDRSAARLSPGLNAGSVALQVLFSKFYRQGEWREALYGPESFTRLYQQMFGDSWARAARSEPLFPMDLAQPPVELPFAPGERWSFTGGPHLSWNSGSARGALDFSPVTGEAACLPSTAWVTASAAGIVARSSHEVVVIDLDGDGYESTGWVLLYLHLPEPDRVSLGTHVEVDDRLGHPSCERGKSTGTHVHLARKYNGEWIPADGPLPFVLSGWEVEAGNKSYAGYLIKGDQIVTANPGGSQSSVIVR